MTKQIQIVDPDPGFSRITGARLSLWGYEVAATRSGADALAQYERGAADLLLLECGLPDMSGLELIERLEERCPAPPFIVFTARDDAGSAAAYLKRGARDYLLKSETSLDRLSEIVSRTLEHLETERRLRETEADIRIASRRDRLLLDELPCLAILLDRRGRILTCNRIATHYGAQPGGRKTELFPEGEPARTALSAGERCRRELELGGVPFEAHWEPREDGCCLFYAFDISDRRREEARRTRLEYQYRQALKMESMGRLAGSLAHDFNNLLISIAGSARLLMRRLPEEGEERPFAERIYDASAGSSKLIHRLLSFAHQDQTRFETVDLHRVLRDTAGLLRDSGPQVTLQLDLKARSHQLSGDASELQNAFINLGLNARDAMPEGGRLVIQTENVPAPAELVDSEGRRPGGSCLRIVVRDNGGGMDRATLARIFEPFFTTKRASGGSGLGLYGVYGCIRNHGGTIEAESRPSRGTVFRILLPVLHGEGRTGSRGPAARGTRCLLLVDDDDVLLQTTRSLLEGLGYRVHSYPNAAEALDSFESIREEVDLALLDLRLPRMDGMDLLDELRRVSPELKAMFLTGYADELDLERFERGVVLGVIRKPFDRDELYTRLAGAMAAIEFADA